MEVDDWVDLRQGEWYLYRLVDSYPDRMNRQKRRRGEVEIDMYRVQGSEP